MLQLARYIGQRIMIGDDIIITIMSVTDEGKVLVGIDAPRETAVHREEIYTKILKERHQAFLAVGEKK